jgi:thiamine-monophosphate kinase
MSQALSEFDLIARFFDVQALTCTTDNLFVSLAIGDDCALLNPLPNHQLAVSVDTLVGGVHFPIEAPPAALAWRALAVSVSDLAAMGATPRAFTLALTLPQADPVWLEGFSGGLARAAKHYGMALVGGDTTRGPLAMSLQVMGDVPVAQALRRDGAQVGDEVYVSGALGAANLALDYLAETQPNGHVAALLQAYYQPSSCIELGQALRGIASAAIDISDGLLADVGHIARRSGLQIALDSTALPIHPAVVALCDPSRALQAASSGGDDYQLAFCVPQHNIAQLETLPFALTRIGRCCVGQGVTIDGRSEQQTGYQHFEVNHDHTR